jgi:hypothetical protein
MTGMELQVPDEEALVRAAVADLERQFVSLDRSRIEASVRRFVGELFHHARVKNFVGLIAERHARAELAGEHASAAR